MKRKENWHKSSRLGLPKRPDRELTERELEQRRENVRKIAEEKKTKPTCKHGHPWTEENTLIRKNGNKTCRECKRISQRTWYAFRKGERLARWGLV